MIDRHNRSDSIDRRLRAFLHRCFSARIQSKECRIGGDVPLYNYYNWARLCPRLDDFSCWKSLAWFGSYANALWWPIR